MAAAARVVGCRVSSTNARSPPRHGWNAITLLDAERGPHHMVTDSRVLNAQKTTTHIYMPLWKNERKRCDQVWWGFISQDRATQLGFLNPVKTHKGFSIRTCICVCIFFSSYSTQIRFARHALRSSGWKCAFPFFFCRSYIWCIFN